MLHLTFLHSDHKGHTAVNIELTLGQGGIIVKDTPSITVNDDELKTYIKVLNYIIDNSNDIYIILTLNKLRDKLSDLLERRM